MIDDKLLKDEEILATAKDSNAIFYTTTRRIIRYEKSLFKENLNSIPFPHITAISFVSVSYWWLSIIGFLMVVIGVPLGGVIGMSLAFVGILLIVIGIFAKSSWYQIKATGMSEKDQKLWRLSNVKASDVKTFASMVENLILKQ